MQWNWKTVYFLLGAGAVIMYFFFNEDKIIVPTWGTILAFLCLLVIAAGESWIAWSKSGALVLTTLGIGKGSSEGFNPSCDKINAIQTGKPSFACIAAGGFVWAGFETKGSKKFYVVPPEHVQEVGGNIFIKTTLRKVGYNELPTYIQQSLNQLPAFKVNKVIEKNNIYFGMTSSLYGTDTAENMKIEEKFLSDMSLQNEYKHKYEETLEKLKTSEKPTDKPFRLIPLEEEE